MRREYYRDEKSMYCKFSPKAEVVTKCTVYEIEIFSAYDIDDFP